MMEHQLAPAKGARKNRKRVGRGDAAGQGSTAGRGNKGQKSRSGSGPPIWFEGGQLPLIKGLPMKRGFHNRFKTYYSLVKLATLDNFDAGASFGEGLPAEPQSSREGRWRWGDQQGRDRGGGEIHSHRQRKD